MLPFPLRIAEVCRRVASALSRRIRREDAEDVAQQTAIELLQRRDVLEPQKLEELAAYAWRIATRHLAHVFREARRRSLRERRWMTDMQSAVPRPDQLMERLETNEAVMATLSQLPETVRTVATLCDIDGWTHTAAAAALGVPIGTVKVRHCRARDALRRNLVPENRLQRSIFPNPNGRRRALGE